MSEQEVTSQDASVSQDLIDSPIIDTKEVDLATIDHVENTKFPDSSFIPPQNTSTDESNIPKKQKTPKIEESKNI